MSEVRPWDDLVVSPRYVEAALDLAETGTIFDGAAGTLDPAVLLDPRGGGYGRSGSTYVRTRTTGPGHYVWRVTPDRSWTAQIEGLSAMAESEARPPAPGGFKPPAVEGAPPAPGGVFMLGAALALLLLLRR